MKRYIKSDTNDKGTYIGGELFELYGYYEEADDWYDFLVARTKEQDNYIRKFGSNYIVYRPDSNYRVYDLWIDPSDLLYDLADSMAIKEGIDVVAYPDHIEVIAYYGSYREVAKLFPINDQKAKELSEILDNSDFAESDTIENEIAQYAWNGASEESILQSWA